MTYRVDISIPALQDAENAFLRLREFNLENSKSWYEGLLESINSLEKFPNRCPIAPESKNVGREIRQLFYGKTKQGYRIYFEILEQEKVVRIYRIWHSSKDSISKDEFEEGKQI